MNGWDALRSLRDKLESAAAKIEGNHHPYCGPSLPDSFYTIKEVLKEINKLLEQDPEQEKNKCYFCGGSGLIRNSCILGAIGYSVVTCSYCKGTGLFDHSLFLGRLIDIYGKEKE